MWRVNHNRFITDSPLQLCLHLQTTHLWSHTHQQWGALLNALRAVLTWLRLKLCKILQFLLVPMWSAVLTASPQWSWSHSPHLPVREFCFSLLSSQPDMAPQQRKITRQWQSPKLAQSYFCSNLFSYLMPWERNVINVPTMWRISSCALLTDNCGRFTCFFLAR